MHTERFKQETFYYETVDVCQVFLMLDQKETYKFICWWDYQRNETNRLFMPLFYSPSNFVGRTLPLHGNTSQKPRQKSYWSEYDHKYQKSLVNKQINEWKIAKDNECSWLELLKEWKEGFFSMGGLDPTTIKIATSRIQQFIFFSVLK